MRDKLTRAVAAKNDEYGLGLEWSDIKHVVNAVLPVLEEEEVTTPRFGVEQCASRYAHPAHLHRKAAQYSHCYGIARTLPVGPRYTED